MSRSTEAVAFLKEAGAFLKAHALDVAISVAVAVATFLILWPFLNPDFESIRGRVTYSWDEGVVLHHALRLEQGEMLYRDFFDFQGFFGYLPFSFGFAVAQPSARTGKIVMFTLMALWSSVTYLTVKEVTHKRWAGILTALYFPLCVWPTYPFAYQHFIADLWATLAVLFAIHGEKGNLRRGWVIAGAISALSMWTSLSEGLPCFVALLAACVLVRYARRQGWDFLGQYLKGAFGFTAFYVLVLASRGALRQAYEAVLIFPFKHYGPGNRTTYANDAGQFIGYWQGRPKQSAAAELLVEMTMNVPKIGVVVSLGVAALLLYRVAHRHFTKRSMHGLIPWETFAPCVYVASLGSLAVPVWYGTTRSDICHIGFIQMMSVIAITSLFAPASTFRRRWWTGKWRLVSVVQLAAGFGVLLVLWQTGKFFKRNVANAKWKDINEHIANDPEHPDRHCATLQARLKPGDKMVALSHGGYTHVMCGTRSAISIPHLLHNDPNYWGAMWPIAAHEIVKRKPRLLLISPYDLAALQRTEPALSSLYIGFDLNYVLKEGRPGRPFETSEWWYTIYGDSGRVEREGPLRFERGKGEPMSSPWVALMDANPTGIFTYLDGEDVQILDRGLHVYILERDADGRTMNGKAFQGVSPSKRMTAVRR